MSKDHNDHEKALVISNGVIDSEEDRLEEVLNLRRKFYFALKEINILENKLQVYKNRDHDKLIKNAI